MRVRPCQLKGLSAGVLYGSSQIVGEPVVVVFRAGVAVLLPRSRPTHQLVRPVAVLQIERPHVLAVILGGMRAARVEQRHLHARLGELLRDPAARRAGADDEHFETFSRVVLRWLHDPFFLSGA